MPPTEITFRRILDPAVVLLPRAVHEAEDMPVTGDTFSGFDAPDTIEVMIEVDSVQGPAQTSSISVQLQQSDDDGDMDPWTSLGTEKTFEGRQKLIFEQAVTKDTLRVVVDDDSSEVVRASLKVSIRRSFLAV